MPIYSENILSPDQFHFAGHKTIPTVYFPHEFKTPLAKEPVTNIITIWKTSLQRLLTFYETHRGDLKTFYPTLFMFFITLNMGCYWWALLTAFPEYLRGAAAWHYFKVSFPVGLLGAVFDSLSFFVTIYIIRRAIKSRNTLEYISHLSIDLIIAIVATFWVLFVFIISGWLIQTLTPAPPVFGEENLVTRQTRYSDMLINALLNPFDNLRNIYFGLIMGFSASLPTCIHVAMFIRSVLRSFNSDTAESVSGQPES